MSTQLQHTGSHLQRVQLQRAPSYKEFGYNEHPASTHWVPLTTSSVTMSTQFPTYKFSYYEHPASKQWVPLTMSLVTMSTQLQHTGSHLQWVRLQRAPSFNTLGPTYNEFGYNEHPTSIHWVLLTMSSVIMSTQLQYTGSHLQRVWLLWAPSLNTLRPTLQAPNFNTLGPAYNEFGYNEHPASIHWVLLTTSSVIMSTQLHYTGSCLQWVQLLRVPSFNTLGPTYNEFGYYEHPSTMSRFFF